MRVGPCAKCGGTMQEGFSTDHTHGGVSVTGWHEGKPIKSMWWGLKLGKPMPVTVWRCGRCGFLESYANPT